MNYCVNWIKCNKALAEKIMSDGKVDFNAIVPEPDFTDFSTDEKRKWYDQSWGPSVNAMDTKCESSDNGTCLISYITFSCPPVPILRAICKQYPNETFDFAYRLEGDDEEWIINGKECFVQVKRHYANSNGYLVQGEDEGKVLYEL